MSEGLAKKLRLKTGQRIIVMNRPNPAYFSEFDVIEGRTDEPEEVIVLFVKTMEELKNETLELIKKGSLKQRGRLLIAYPKKGNKLCDTYIHRDEIFPALEVGEDGYIPGSNYKFNQMVRLDDTYTIVGIKNEPRGKTKGKAASQSVEDYTPFISVIEQELSGDGEAFSFFKSLTPGYQKNWARYVYSAKRTETQNKRFDEMSELLRQGVKSKK